MLLANKFHNLVVGLDIHFVIIAGVSVPVPHPYVGYIFDIGDLVPFVGSSVNINNVPRGNSHTAGRLFSSKHLPLGGPFMLPPLIGHDSVNFFGSPKVNVENAYMSPAGYMLMTCSDIGSPLTLSPGKNYKPSANLYLPSSNSIPIPTGKPVNLGGPFVPDIGGMVTTLVSSFGFGAITKKSGNLLRKLNNDVLKKHKVTRGLSRALCKLGFDPVDLITGRVIYDGEDFELPGVIPITWKRSWYSDSNYEGILGHGFHNNYDLSLFIEKEHDLIAMILEDGRLTSFPMLSNEGDEYHNRSEKLTLKYKNKDQYIVYNHSTNLSYTFDKTNKTTFKPTYISNEEGNQIRLLYDSNNKLTKIIDTVGRILDLRLDKHGRVTSITASHQSEQRTLVSYSYNEDGDLIKITDALNQDTIIRYHKHLMLKKTDRNGQSFYWEYDNDIIGSKCTKTWGDKGILTGGIEYKDKHNIVTDSLGRITTYYFNEKNLCTQITDPMGNHSFHEYTDHMEPYRDINQEGNITGYSYDKRGNLTKFHNPDGSIHNYFYNEKDRLVMSQDPIGTKKIQVYKNDRLSASIAPNGAVTSYQYNKKGLLSVLIDEVGNESQFQYDQDDNLNKIISPKGLESVWNYDKWGRCIETIDIDKHNQVFIYDQLDRITNITLADQSTATFRYNAYDEVTKSISKINSIEHIIDYEYTPLGSIKMRSEKNKKLEFSYNSADELVAIKNENNEYYKFERDANGEIIHEVGFDYLEKEFIRDRTGRVLRVERLDNRFTEYEYDLSGRLTRAEYYDGSWETYSYDKSGNLIEACNQFSELQLIRDESGMVQKEIIDGHEITSSYDKLNNRVKITSSLGADIDLKRNSIGQIEKVLAMTGDQSNSWTAEIKYNSIGKEIEKTLPGGIFSRKSYDSAGRLIEHRIRRGQHDVRHRTYNWDANNQLREIANQLKNGKTQYSHNLLGKITSAKYEDGSLDHQLPDSMGNIYKSKEKNERKYSNGGKLIKDGNTYYIYDCDGNMSSKRTDRGTWNYQWYGTGMLKEAISPQGESTVFEYDTLGRRTAKISKDIIKRWLWDGKTPLHEWDYPIIDRPVKVINELGVIQDSNPEPINNLTTWVFNEGTFVPSAKITSEDSFTIVTDHLGTPKEMYNSSGIKTWEVEHDTKGKVRNLIKGNLTDCPFRNQGQYEDIETGLYYNRFRYYSNETGMYISKDPIGLRGGITNLYAYVGIDALGLMPLSNPVDQGHHFVPHSAATELGIKPFNKQTGVPAIYWSEEQWKTGYEHSALHGYNGIGSETKPLVKASQIREAGMTNEQWMQSLENHYNNPAIQQYRGDLHVINSSGKKGKLIKKDVSPKEAWLLIKKWAKEQGEEVKCSG